MVIFTVPGRPVPKQRPRLGRNGNVYTPRQTREYERAVARAGRLFFKSPYFGPVSLHVHVYLAGVRGAGDLDNYIKSIQDGLNGIAWRDDRQIVRLKAGITVRPGVNERAEVLIMQLLG